MRRVYPRVGGGNLRDWAVAVKGQGLSPRGRGKLATLRKKNVVIRSIPAWAGETHTGIPRFPPPGVYPRVGGGNRRRPNCLRANWGLSPRGRGKPGDHPAKGEKAGSIPAWAGETIPPCHPCRSTRVYPRVGGGNVPAPRPAAVPAGLSPRGRGKPGQPLSDAAGIGSIPAWAGETLSGRMLVRNSTVYPRVGGGNGIGPRNAALAGGLSPRGRGKRRCFRCGGPLDGSIPAWAGETQKLPALPAPMRVYPRVGGGNGSSVAAAIISKGLSPRGRGKPGGPAWA